MSGSPVETSVLNSSCEVLSINEPVCDTLIHKLHSRGSHILIAEGVTTFIMFGSLYNWHNSYSYLILHNPLSLTGPYFPENIYFSPLFPQCELPEGQHLSNNCPENLTNLCHSELLMNPTHSTMVLPECLLIQYTARRCHVCQQTLYKKSHSFPSLSCWVNSCTHICSSVCYTCRSYY